MNEPESGRLKQGMKLRYPLYESNGMLLLAAGSEVTPQLRTLLDRRGVHLEFQCVLEVLEGNPLGTKIPVKKDLLSIGRDPLCEIRPDSDIVSSLHCRIIKRAFGVMLADCQSTNGTFLNDEQIKEEVELSNEDKIRVGNMLFGVELDAVVATESDGDQEALDEWILAEPFADGPPSEPSAGQTVPLAKAPKIIRRDVKEL